MYFEKFNLCKEFVESFEGLSAEDKKQYVQETILAEQFIVRYTEESFEGFLHQFVEGLEKLLEGSEEKISCKLQEYLKDMKSFSIEINDFLNREIELGSSLVICDENDICVRMSESYQAIKSSLARLSSLVNLAHHRAAIALYKLYGDVSIHESLKQLVDESPEHLWVVRNDDGSVNYKKSLDRFNVRNIYDTALETEYEE